MHIHTLHSTVIILGNVEVQKQNKIRLQQQRDLLASVDKEIADLDSLKKLEYFNKDKPNTIKLGEMLIVSEKEPKLYHNDIMELMDKKQLDKENQKYLSYMKVLAENLDQIIRKNTKTINESDSI